MQQHIKRIALCIILLACIFSWYPLNTAYASDTENVSRTVTVAFAESPGLSELHEDGSRSGVFYEWLLEIAKYTKWEYEFIDGEVEDLLMMLEGDQIDIMCGMYYYEGLEERYNYPHYSVGTSSSLLIRRGDDHSMKSFDLATLKGKKIGVYKKAVGKVSQLENFLSYNSITAEVILYEDADEMDKALDSGEIDLLLGGDAYVTGDRTVVERIGGDSYYIVTGIKKAELCRELNTAIETIYMTDPNFAAEVQSSYFPEFYDYSISLTEEDLEYVANAPAIRVALLKDTYPLSYTRKGLQTGVCVDVFERIAEQTGLEFEFTYVDSYREMFDLASSGEVDIVGSFMDSEEAALEAGMILTKKYISLDEAVIKNKKIDYPSENLRVSMVEGECVREGIEEEQVVYYATYRECIDAVEKGKADITYVPTFYAEDALYKDFYTKAVVVTSNGPKRDISIAMTKAEDVALFSVINKGVNNIAAEEIDAILSKNLLSLGENRVSLKAFVYTNPLLCIIFVGGILFLIMLLILLYGRFTMKNKMIKLHLEKAIETNQTRAEFLSRMSHEIRTPMNAVIGLTQLARQSSDLEPKVEEYLEEIQSTSQFLLSLVNDILDMSKIENSKMVLNLAPLNLRNILEQVESMMRIQSEKQDVELMMQYDIQHEDVIGDALRIKQVMLNLVSNAVKFTKSKGKVLVSLKETGQDGEQCRMRFSVQDNGIGIDKRDLEVIFQSYGQGTVNVRTGQGTGLGLAISRNLVHLMGGQLSVESEVGQGSEFYFTLQMPMIEASEKTEEKVAECDYHMQGVRVLLAEDNDINAKIVTHMLHAVGVETERALDGQMVVDMFAEHPEGYYDMILMDIQMPVQSGLTATVEIRKLDMSYRKRVPIIAMTANTFQEDREKALEAGMNDFVAKPFQAELLYETLKKNLVE